MTSSNSNSSLICMTIPSQFRTKHAFRNIDTITIHTMSGNLSIESCGKLFQKSGKNASSNYGIGTDGRIALYVDEKDASWCSSNTPNDERAITIEVANDGGKSTGWHISDEAFNSLVLLVVDICRRNGIPELRWKNDPTLIGKSEQQNMTVHRWFANKSCPGDYLISKFDELCELVNDELNQDMYYFVQVGAFKNKANAEKLAKRLHEAGFKYYIKKGRI